MMKLQSPERRASERAWEAHIEQRELAAKQDNIQAPSTVVILTKDLFIREKFSYRFNKALM